MDTNPPVGSGSVNVSVPKPPENLVKFPSPPSGVSGTKMTVSSAARKSSEPEGVVLPVLISGTRFKSQSGSYYEITVEGNLASLHKYPSGGTEWQHVETYTVDAALTWARDALKSEELTIESIPTALSEEASKPKSIIGALAGIFKRR